MLNDGDTLTVSNVQRDKAVKDDGRIIVRLTADLTTTDGRVLPVQHKYVVTPDDDVTNEDPGVKAIANAARTPEAVAKWEAIKAASRG